MQAHRQEAVLRHYTDYRTTIDQLEDASLAFLCVASARHNYEGDADFATVHNAYKIVAYSSSVKVRARFNA